MMFLHIFWKKFTDVSEVSVTLRMEEVSASKKSFNFYETTRRNITEDSCLQLINCWSDYSMKKRCNLLAWWTDVLLR
jgi:hypothetical protein